MLYTTEGQREKYQYEWRWQLNENNKVAARQRFTKIIGWAVLVVLLVSMIIGASVGFYYLGRDQVDLKLTNQIYELIDKYYYKDIDKEEYDLYAAMGMSQIMDKYSGLMLKDTMPKPTYGFTMSTTAYGRHFVTNVEHYSPAGSAKCNLEGKEYKLERGDEIVAINDKNIVGLNAEATQSLLNDTNCILTVAKQDGTKAQFHINKGLAYEQEEARYIDMPGNVGMIQLDSFTGSAVHDFNRAANEFRASDNNKLILDLRGNGGGSIDILSEISAYLIEQDNVDINIIMDKKGGKSLTKSAKHKKNKEQDNTYLGEGKAGYELVVLMDGNSASASEALIGALQYYEPKTIFIGSPTYGKGIAQGSFPVDGYNLELHITIGYFYVPTIGKDGDMEWNSNHGVHIPPTTGFDIPVMDSMQEDREYYAGYYNNDMSKELAVARALDYFETGK